MLNIQVLLVFSLIFLQDRLSESAGPSSGYDENAPLFQNRQEAYESLARLNCSRNRVDRMILHGEIVILDELEARVPGGTQSSSEPPQESEPERRLLPRPIRHAFYEALGFRNRMRDLGLDPDARGHSHPHTVPLGRNVGLALTGYGNTFIIHTVPLNNDSESRSPRNSSQEHAPNVSATSERERRGERGHIPSNETAVRRIRRRFDESTSNRAPERAPERAHEEPTMSLRTEDFPIGRDTGEPSTARLPRDRDWRRRNRRPDNFRDGHDSSSDD